MESGPLGHDRGLTPVMSRGDGYLRATIDPSRREKELETWLVALKDTAGV